LLMPRSAFRQYLRLVAGMILVLVVLEPVLGWLGGEVPSLGSPPGGLTPGWFPSVPAGPGGAGNLRREVQAAVDRQVRAAFRERVAAAVREVLLGSGSVSEAWVEVVLGGDGFEITGVRARVRARAGGTLSPTERERLRGAVAAYLGISPDRVTVGEG